MLSEYQRDRLNELSVQQQAWISNLVKSILADNAAGSIDYSLVQFRAESKVCALDIAYERSRNARSAVCQYLRYILWDMEEKGEIQTNYRPNGNTGYFLA